MHQFLSLLELMQEPVDLLDVGPAAQGDTPPPAAVDDPRIFAFFWRHRTNDRLQVAEFLFIKA